MVIQDGGTSFGEAIEPILAESSDLLTAMLQSDAVAGTLFYEDTSKTGLSCAAVWPKRLPSWNESRQRINGLGFYAFSDREKAHAAGEGFAPAGWRNTAHRIAASLGSGAGRRAVHPTLLNRLVYSPDAPDAISLREKRTLVEALVDAAFSLDDRVNACTAVYQDAMRRMLVINSEGRAVAQARARLGVHITVTLACPAGEATGQASRGAVDEFGALTFGGIEEVARRAVERAVQCSEARPLESHEKMPVLFAGGWAGLWIHEAIGHQLESDVAPPIWRSALGKRLAGDVPLTLIDDPTLAGAQGALEYDDEGEPGRATTLIEDGVLRALLTDRRQAHLHAWPATGNGRRQDFRHPPLPRMTTLCLLPGETAAADLLSSVKDGLYALQVAGGIAKDGAYELNVLHGYRIENGRITHPVSNLLVRGEAMELPGRIRGIGTEAFQDDEMGRCVKSGQTTPASVSAPAVLFDGLEVVQRPASEV